MPRILRVVCRVVCLVLLSTLGTAVLSGSASASVLCTGYAGCAHAGKSSAGYQRASGRMWWGMYAGHNCTNYVAYRMVRSGMPNTRPWTGSGNATNWGVAMRSLTNGSPAVGAVAWWRANVGPAGSVGHVAYIERVVSAHEIVVSQDSWNGNFSWATITRGSGSWPSGFVHLHDAPLTNTARPVVSGVRQVGARLSATPGGWSPAPTSVHYQWRADGVDIGRAARSTLVLTPALRTKRISVVVTASRIGYPTRTVRSLRTTRILRGLITNLARPTVAGHPVVGSTLTASTGRWAPTATRLAYQWSAGTAAIRGATSRTLAIGPDLIGKALSVRVTAFRAGYRYHPATSVPTPPVAPGTLPTSVAPVVRGTATPGHTLRVTTRHLRGAQVSVSWWRDGVPARGGGGSTYALRAADVGSRLSAHVTVSRPGYRPVTRTTPAQRVQVG
jgi:surface antigen